MKKTCDGCRAADIWFCNLGYKTATRRRRGCEFATEMYPLGACPKPVTYSAMAELFEARIAKADQTNSGHTGSDGSDAVL